MWGMGGKCLVGGEWFPTSLEFHFLFALTVGSFRLDTHDEFSVLTPIAYPVSKSQSEPVLGFRVSADLPALIFASDSDGGGFWSSSIPLL